MLFCVSILTIPVGPRDSCPIKNSEENIKPHPPCLAAEKSPGLLLVCFGAENFIECIPN